MDMRNTRFQNALISIFLYFTAINAQWERSNEPNDVIITSLIEQNNNIFVSTAGAGLFKSDNEGVTWKASDSGLTSTLITSMVSNGTNLFCGSIGGGIFISDDNGSSWKPVNSGLENINGDVLDIYSLLVYKSIVYAGTSEGLFCSSNNGVNWNKIYPSDKIISIVVNDSVKAWITPNKFYIDRWFVPIAISSYSLVMSGPNIYVGADSGTVFCFKETDSVKTTPTGGSYHEPIWKKEILKIPANSAVSFLLIREKKLIAGTNTGEMFAYDSTSLSWSPFKNIRFNSPISCFYYYKDRKIFAGTSDSGIYSSGDGGASWSHSNSGIRMDAFVNTFSSTVNKLFAGSDGGVFVSKDSGLNWHLTNNGLTNTRVNSILSTHSSIFAGTGIGQMRNDCGVFVSIDSGSQWNKFNSGLPSNTSILCLASTDSNIFAGTGFGIFSSAFKNIQWKFSMQGLSDGYVNTLHVSGTTILAGTNKGGIFKSSNSDINWAAVNSGLPSGVSILSIASSDNRFFAGTNGKGVFLSTNNMQTWGPKNSGLPSNGIVNSLVINKDSIFAGTDGNGVFLTTDNGANWNEFNSGLVNKHVNSLFIHNKILFAGTCGDGIWLWNFSSPSSVKGQPENRKGNYKLALSIKNNYNLSVHLFLSTSVLVSGQVFDLTGRLLATKPEVNLKSGFHNLILNIENNKEQCYIVKMRIGSDLQSMLIPLVK